MSTLNWEDRRNLENSLAEFLQDQSSSLTVFYQGESKSIDIRVGFAPRDDWSLPNIAVYHDSRTALRGFVGQNKRLKTHLMIIDVRALDDGMRQDLADWVSDTINDGFDFYSYSPDAVSPDTPNKTLTGKASVDFVSDNRILADTNADEYNKYRHNISINVTIAI